MDVSFYNSGQQQNPFDTVGKAVGLSTAIIQNRRAQGELAGDQAVGAAAQQAFDANTGRFDTNKFNSIVAANPAAAMRALPAAQHSATLQGSYLSNQGADVGQSGNRLNDFYTSLGPLLSSGAPLTRAQIMSTATDLLHQGRLMPKDLVAINSEIPMDPKHVGAYAQNKFGSVLSAPQQASPQQTGIDPANSQPITGTAGQFLKQATTPAGGAAPVAPGVRLSLPLAQPEQIAASSTALNSDLSTAGGKMQALRPLQNALPLVEQLSHADFGPGSAQFSQLKSALQTAGVIPDASKIADMTALRQESNKYLLQYAQAAQNAGRSDHALSTALHANPNIDFITQPANLALIKNQIAVDRMDAAIPQSYAAAHPEYKTNPTASVGYAEHKSKFAQSFDPRAFRFDLMSPQERADLQKSLGAKDSPAYQKFVRSYTVAKPLLQAGPQQ